MKICPFINLFVKYTYYKWHVRFVSWFQLSLLWFILFFSYCMFNCSYKSHLPLNSHCEILNMTTHSFTALRVSHKQSTVKLMNYITWQKMCLLGSLIILIYWTLASFILLLLHCLSCNVSRGLMWLAVFFSVALMYCENYSECHDMPCMLWHKIWLDHKMINIIGSACKGHQSGSKFHFLN